jgi:hypothetical protein
MALGFKLMSRQLLRYPEVLLKLMVDEYRIIHLVRQNHLDVVISQRLMKQLGKAHSTEQVDRQTVHLEPSSLLRALTWREREIELTRTFLLLLGKSPAFGLPSLEITYASLRRDAREALNAAASFLSVPSYQEYDSRFKKISTAPDWERIENYDEVRQALRGTRFCPLLDDAPES